MPRRFPPHLLEANVLTDYFEHAREALDLAAHRLGTIGVPQSLLLKVRGLDPDGCLRLGLQIVEERVDQLVEAGSRSGAISFESHLCLLLARERGWVCVSNDPAFRRACAETGVRVRGGLDLLVDLVGERALPAPRALSLARRMERENPRHLTPEALAQLRAGLLQIRRTSPRRLDREGRDARPGRSAPRPGRDPGPDRGSTPAP